MATASGLAHGEYTILVLGGIPIRLAFVQQPTDVMVGQVITPPVTVQLKALFDNDSSGQCDNCQGFVIQLLLDGTEVGRADGGIFGQATFSDLTFSTPGTYRLIAKRVLTDESDFPLIPALSQAFTVSAAPGSPSPTPTVTPTPSPSPVLTGTPLACPGDCDGNGKVTINELVLLVNISVDAAPLSECEAGDLDGNGQITIDELIRSVHAALDGCTG